MECCGFTLKAAVGDDQLREIDAQIAGAAQQIGRHAGRRAARANTGIELTALVVGVHAAVAVHRHAQRQVGVDHLVVAEFGNQEIGRFVAVGCPVEETGAARHQYSLVLQHNGPRATIRQ